MCIWKTCSGFGAMKMVIIDWIFMSSDTILDSYFYNYKTTAEHDTHPHFTYHRQYHQTNTRLHIRTYVNASKYLPQSVGCHLLLTKLIILDVSVWRMGMRFVHFHAFTLCTLDVFFANIFFSTLPFVVMSSGCAQILCYCYLCDFTNMRLQIN